MIDRIGRLLARNVLMLSIAPFFVVTGESGTMPVSLAGASAAPESSCMICIQSGSGESAMHAFVEGSAGMCDEAEERATNNCDSCGGASDCHTEIQEGACHVSCGPIIPGGGDELFLTALARQDAVVAARFIRLVDAGPTAGRLMINESRNAIQELDCRGNVTRHITVSPEFISELVALTD